MQNLPPSSKNFDIGLILEWGFVLFVLIFLIYAARKIMNEKTNYLEEALWCDFFDLRLAIPKWWTQVNEESDFLVYQRTDTKYDWYCEIKKISSSLSCDEYLKKYLNDKKVILDNSYDSYEKTVVSENLILNGEVNKRIQDFTRYEATATIDNLERAYIDIIAIKMNEKEIYFFESKSSVLNGCVEGPYFEECLKNLKVS